MYSDSLSSAPLLSSSQVMATESERKLSQVWPSSASVRSMDTRGCCTTGCLPDSVRESELDAATNAACDVWWRLICSPSLLALVSGKERSS